MNSRGPGMPCSPCGPGGPGGPSTPGRPGGPAGQIIQAGPSSSRIESHGFMPGDPVAPGSPGYLQSNDLSSMDIWFMCYRFKIIILVGHRTHLAPGIQVGHAGRADRDWTRRHTYTRTTDASLAYRTERMKWGMMMRRKRRSDC
ncbi:hypothetical protein PRIPAC_89542 [Pristionchus pacificus]|uniref:Uncharacterized protein n=1 Tax=Pristionchus pacificus TaxID=54126 RepID=A0A2A6CU09_PRIPA|nr:hypothetical protein PRIPAC_89542 [Pristionchus pacificus]|eukprot:PDM81537.1 hypothetical protein PRIPAC_35413 [Pristionchus pacificus]